MWNFRRFSVPLTTYPGICNRDYCADELLVPIEVPYIATKKWMCGWNLLENVAGQLNIRRILILRIRSGFLNKNIKFFHLRRSVWGVFALLNMIIRPGSSQYHLVALCHHNTSVHINLGDQVYEKGRPFQYLTLSSSQHTDLEWHHAYRRFSTPLLQKVS